MSRRRRYAPTWGKRQRRTHFSRANPVRRTLTRRSRIGIERLEERVVLVAPSFTTILPLAFSQVGDPIVYDADTDQEGDPGFVYSLPAVPTVGTPPLPGMAIDSATGEFTWTPTPDQEGFRSFTIRATNDLGEFTEQQSNLVINGPPELDPIGDMTIEELNELSFTATAMDDTILANLQFSLVAPVPTGAMIGAMSGVFSWTPTADQGPDVVSITVRVSDGFGGMDTETFMVTVTEGGNGNVAPVLDPIGDQVINELNTLQFTATASDADVGDTLTFSLAPGAPVAAMIDPDTGDFSWTPNESDGPGTFDITVIVSDGTEEDMETIEVTVGEVPTAPVIDPIGDFTIDELETLTFTATASDVDLPENTLTFTLGATAPATAMIDPVTGEFTWTPTADDGPNVFSFFVGVLDGNGPGALAGSTLVNVTVNDTATGTNTPPMIDPISNQTVDELTELSFFVDVTDPDVPPDTLTFALGPTAPTGAMIDPATGQFTWTPTEDQGPDTYTIPLTVFDGTDTTLGSFMVTVNEVNVAPVIDPIADMTVDEGDLVNFFVTATDTDLPAQDLMFSLAPGAPVGSTIDPTTGEFMWTPTEDQGPDTYMIPLTVSDGMEATQSSFTVTVNESNTLPIIDPIDDMTVGPGDLVNFTVNAVDADVPTNDITFSLGAGAPPGAMIDPDTGEFLWQTMTSDAGQTFPITVEVFDGSETATENFAVMVQSTSTSQGSIHGTVFLDADCDGIRDSGIIAGTNPDAVFVIDVSGSTASNFGGTPVGDVNGDGSSNDILDAQLAGFIALNQELIDQGFGTTAEVAIVVFGAGAAQVDMDPIAAGTQLTVTPTTDADMNGTPDVVDILETITRGAFGVGSGSTNFAAALSETLDTFNTVGTVAADGNVIFLSDGFPNSGGAFDDEVAALNLVVDNLRAFGVGTGASLTDLQIIDPMAEIFTTTDELLDVFTGGTGMGTGSMTSFTESGLAGVTVYLDLNDNGMLDVDEPTTVSMMDDPGTPDVDETGMYWFNVDPGSYVVRIVLPSMNHQQSTPDGDGSHRVTVDDGQQVEMQDFGVCPPTSGSLSGFVWADTDNDGIRDFVEVPIPNVPITLIGTYANGMVGMQVTMTDATGAYRFDNLMAGDYTIRETQPMEFVDGIDSIGSQGGDDSVNDEFTVQLAAGQSGTDNNFGERGLRPEYVGKLPYITTYTNAPPVAQDDAETTNRNTPVPVTVLMNDMDIDGTLNPATVEVMTPPTNGTATPQPDGSILYTPDPTFVGVDTFVYRVRDDDWATSNPATVTVTVIDNNLPPVAVMDMDFTDPGGMITIDVLANDMDPDGTLDVATVEIVPMPGPMNGTAQVNPDGTITYTHNGGGSTADSFVYTVRDNLGAISNQALVSITIEDIVGAGAALGGGLADASMFAAAGAVTMTSGGGSTGMASVVHAGDTVYITGTPGDDEFRLMQDGGLRISVNGEEYEFAPYEVLMVTFDGGGGNDSAQVEGTGADEHAELDGTMAMLVGPNLTVNVRHTAVIRIDGGGGSDDAVLFDHEGDDHVHVRDRYTTREGSGYRHFVRGFDTVSAYGGVGDDDAVIYDTAYDDHLFAKPEWARLTGGGQSKYVRGFATVRAYAGMGDDTAVLYDSLGADELMAKSTWTRLTGPGFDNYVKGFDAVNAYAGAGHDVARLFDSPGNDVLIQKATWSRLSGAGFSNYAKGFDAVWAYAGGGYDAAMFYDSPQDETVVATPERTRLTRPDMLQDAKGFDEVVVYAGGGFDRATLTGSAAADTLTTSPDGATLVGNGYRNTVMGFDEVVVDGDAGTDTATVNDSALAEVLTASGNELSLTHLDLGLAYLLRDFESVVATATTGEDTADVDLIDFALETIGDWDLL